MTRSAHRAHCGVMHSDCRPACRLSILSLLLLCSLALLVIHALFDAQSTTSGGFSVLGVQAAEDHTYADGESVILWANKVGPYHNPSETYPYYSSDGPSAFASLCPQRDPSAAAPSGSAGAANSNVPLGRALQEPPSSFGLLLEGDHLVDTGLDFPFKLRSGNDQFHTVCELHIDTPELVQQLESLVQQHYWYHLIVDDLPLFGMIGEFISAEEMKGELDEAARQAQQAGEPAIDPPIVPAAQGFIYTHRDFSISFNGAQIIEVNLTSENPRPIVFGETYPITYSIHWVPSVQRFEDRFDRYLDYAFFDHQIHWFSIMNSFMLVVFLCGLVLLILSRTIKTSIQSNVGMEKFIDAETGSQSYRSVPVSPTTRELDALGDETGWKLLVGDVFRAPKHLMLYGILLGAGVQLLALIVLLLLLALFATYYYAERGLLARCILLIYSLTSLLGGYVSGWFFKLHGGVAWKRSMLATAGFFPALVLTIVIFLETLAESSGSHGIVTWQTMLLLLSVWGLISAPLTVLGALWARRRTVAGNFPCRVNALRRLIPSEANPQTSGLPINPNSTANQWYTNYYLLLVMSGILPFGSIFIEMYFVFTSFWNFKYYFVYGFLALVFVMLLVVTVCVSIVSTYILLNSEDYRWHWMAFMSGCSSSGYILLYSLYYFAFKTNMAGTVQTAFYFSYVLAAVMVLALVTGSVASIGTRLFIHKIYSYTKAD